MATPVTSYDTDDVTVMIWATVAARVDGRMSAGGSIRASGRMALTHLYLQLSCPFLSLTRALLGTIWDFPRPAGGMVHTDKNFDTLLKKWHSSTNLWKDDIAIRCQCLKKFSALIWCWQSPDWEAHAKSGCHGNATLLAGVPSVTCYWMKPSPNLLKGIISCFFPKCWIYSVEGVHRWRWMTRALSKEFRLRGKFGSLADHI